MSATYLCVVLYPRVLPPRRDGSYKTDGVAAMLVFLTLLVSKLCCCESLSSIEMFDVFDESDIELLPIGPLNVTDNYAFNDSDTLFGRYVKSTFLERESSSEIINITKGTLDDDKNGNAEMRHSKPDVPDKLIISNNTINGLTNNTFTDNYTDEITYDEANDGRNYKTPAEILSNNTANKNENANKTSSNNATKFLAHNREFNNNGGNLTTYPKKEVVVYHNKSSDNKNADIIARTQNDAELLNNNKPYSYNRANIDREPINELGYFYNNAADNHINQNKEPVFDDTERSKLNSKNINANIKTQIPNKTELSSDYPRNQNGGYFWTPFTPFNNAVTNGTTSNVDMNNTTFNKGTLPAFSIPASPFSCPEEEPPTNIGPYEVPTERDMLVHMKNHLLAMYQGFHTRAMHFLKDIKEATQASWSRRRFCRSPAELTQYRRCVRWAGDMSVRTTKSLVTALETIRADVAQLIQGKVCSMSALTIDPVHLLRILAAEKVSLEFALPDFLRQLHACARHCGSARRRNFHEEYLKSAHLTDQDFVMRHYFTQQNYNQQLKQKYKF